MCPPEDACADCCGCRSRACASLCPTPASWSNATPLGDISPATTGLWSTGDRVRRAAGHPRLNHSGQIQENPPCPKAKVTFRRRRSVPAGTRLIEVSESCRRRYHLAAAARRRVLHLPHQDRSGGDNRPAQHASRTRCSRTTSPRGHRLACQAPDHWRRNRRQARPHKIKSTSRNHREIREPVIPGELQMALITFSSPHADKDKTKSGAVAGSQYLHIRPCQGTPHPHRLHCQEGTAAAPAFVKVSSVDGSVVRWAARQRARSRRPHRTGPSLLPRSADVDDIPPTQWRLACQMIIRDEDIPVEYPSK